MWERRDAYGVLVGKPERKRLLGRSWHRWKDTIKMYLQEVGWGGNGLVDLAWDRGRWLAIVNVVMNLRVP
jgi:hypothetical protein